MDQQTIARPSLDASPAECYQEYFVPAIGGPVAEDLAASARLQPGERVLDVACGTGVVARLAATRVGAAGSVTGLDIHPGMLAVARSATPLDLSIEWLESDAEALPLPDGVFDVVLCQMGLQFMPGKLAALREMRRVLAPGGRAAIIVPGPKPPLFSVLTEALARHVGQQAAAFSDRVFSMHDVDELRELVRGAGFRDVRVEARPKRLRLPEPAEFLWQYVRSTPLSQPVAQASEASLAALERDVREGWRAFVEDGVLSLQVGMTTATATK